ncbi:TATA binding protein of transcription factor TFIID [Halorientalis persicus]|uniref:TATA-box-binding protein n=1 Tax=Halorientalis persicus TaxID=1367881 RepID=A0A1H8USU2_9EURY|nr:hypothetical protein [Halorientalis persicus]SEP06231.1 TATA binding protein of transcription factor TFIID [Halorientalis persicus]
MTNVRITEIENGVPLQQLNQAGIEVVNIVGSLRLERELDLEELADDLEHTSYHPETYSSLIFRPPEHNISILTPRSGKLAIVGAKSPQDLLEGADVFLKKLESLGVQINKEASEILVQNIVGKFELDEELDLSVISLGFGLESVEYEPEQFPGLIYKKDDEPTVMLFRTGKGTITGANSYRELLSRYHSFRDELADVKEHIDSSNSQSIGQEK